MPRCFRAGSLQHLKCLVVWPNINGSFWDLLAIEGAATEGVMGSASGCFQTNARQDNAVSWAARNNETGNDGISLDLSRGSSVYSGTELQPSALQCLACIRC